MNERELFDAYHTCPAKDGLLAVLRASQNTVYNLCYQVLLHAQDAEDASQKVFLRVLDVLPRISNGEHYKRLLSHMAFQVALNMIETRKTRRAHEMKKAEGASYAVPAIPPEEPTFLHEHIDRLDPDLKCLLVDHYFEGKPMEAMASERGCSRVAVWKRLEKAKERLRLSLSGSGLAALAVGMQSTLEAMVFTPVPRNLVGEAIAAKAAAMVGAVAQGPGAGFLSKIQGPVMPADRIGGWVMAGMKGKSGIALLGLAAVVLLAGGFGVVSRATCDRPGTPVDIRPPQAPILAGARKPSLPPTALAVPQKAPLPEIVLKSARTPRPYPFVLPRPDWNPAVRAAWDALQTPISINQENMPLDQLLQVVSKRTGLVIKVDPNLKAHEEMVTLVLSECKADGALRLLLQPRNKTYALQEDGTLFVSIPEKAVSAYSQEIVHVNGALWDLSNARFEDEQGDERIAFERTIALMSSRRVSPPQGERTLSETLQAISTSAELKISNDPAEEVCAQVAKLLGQKSLNVVEELPLADQLKKLLSAAGLDFAVGDRGVIYISTSDGAERIRQEVARQEDARRAWAAQLDRPLGVSGERSMAELTEAVGKTVGLPLISSREVWESPVTGTIQEGATVRESLDRFRAAGLRWTMVQGSLYLWSKP